ncbi:nucleotidyltransferase [Spirosoma endbachense]|uniref:Nucleotidyltransferase n=1 Tax=Spirosoma endbachense TaxID=2666025 RepID=A0A6P1VUG8_9BACT|nr:nucleotidyltransferase [Spirosoma endbachense]QHV95620.1 nucleotidyltransferase [Spirosoma endbachense]
MASTVNNAFAEFLCDTVNLDADETKTAYKSRDWLLDEQINALPGRYSDFPLLAPAYHLNYGSFARKTKIRPLNDIDMMIGLHGEGSTYLDYGDRVEITINPNAQRLTGLCHDDTSLLNSRKVMNKFKAGLSKVHQYKSAEIKYTQQAAVLNLSSYNWSFDIVPCFMTAEDESGRTYYLIPDGKGHWMKTDPRIDKELTTSVNQQHSGYVLNVLRLLKFWTKRPIITTIPSYLLETIVLKYYEAKYTETTRYPDVEIPYLLDHIADVIRWDVEDPKGIQGNINRLEQETRNRISAVTTRYAEYAREARQHETNGDHKASIKAWQDVFGPSFPSFV